MDVRHHEGRRHLVDAGVALVHLAIQNQTLFCLGSSDTHRGTNKPLHLAHCNPQWRRRNRGTLATRCPHLRARRTRTCAPIVRTTFTRSASAIGHGATGLGAVVSLVPFRVTSQEASQSSRRVARRCP
jgi:hypothetical protein